MPLARRGIPSHSAPGRGVGHGTTLGMHLEYFLPSPAYRAWITVHTVLDGLTQATTALLPAMLPNLHIRLSGRSSYVFADGRRVAAPAITLLGPTNTAYEVELEAGTLVAAAGLLPAGWLSLIRSPAREFADGLIDGADLWGPHPCALALEQLLACRLDGRHTRIVEELLRLPARPHEHSRFVLAADHWLEHSPDLSVDALSETLGVGRRHLQRIMLETYGAPPKALAMKYRALRVAAYLAAHEQPVLADALTGYADQPHLTRDFRRFVGVTPGAFLRDCAGITAGTFAGRHRAGASRPLVLWS